MIIYQKSRIISYTISYRCNTSNEFKAYASLYHKLYTANETGIFRLTGCLSTCDKYEYTMRQLTNLEVFEQKGHLRGDRFKMQFVISTGLHEQREQVIMKVKSKMCNGRPLKSVHFQYIIYDSNSFIADVGGYLGLLLGQSMFGVYQLTMEWIKKLRCRRKHSFMV